MFNRKNNNGNNKTKNDSLDFKTENYMMKDSYFTKNLVVANLEYVSSTITPFPSPLVVTTEQRYLFEKLNCGNKIRYRELFTGFVADTKNVYFDLPYVVNIFPLKEVLPTIADNIPKYSLLLIMNKINDKKDIKRKSK